MNFEILEHTADIGLRAWGDSWNTMLENATLAMVSIAVELEDVQPAETRTLRIEGDDDADLVVNWLNEVLYLLDGQFWAAAEVAIERSGNTVTGVLRGEPRTDSHRAKLIVKGVTYHQLRVEEREGVWCCEVFLDI